MRHPTEILAVTIAGADGEPRHAFSHGEQLRVRVEVIHHADNRSPCFGIQLKSTDDIVLWGFTTQMMDLALPPRSAGSTAVYEWHLRTDFGGGRYVLAIGSGGSSSGQYMPHFRLHYAGHFDVIPQPRGGRGWLEPDARFVVAAAAEAQ